MKNRKKLAVACAATLGFILGIGGTNAYLTSYDQVVNVVGVGNQPRGHRHDHVLCFEKIPGGTCK